MAVVDRLPTWVDRFRDAVRQFLEQWPCYEYEIEIRLWLMHPIGGDLGALRAARSAKRLSEMKREQRAAEERLEALIACATLAVKAVPKSLAGSLAGVHTHVAGRLIEMVRAS